MRNRPIIVAGGAGYIGSHFCHVAAERGFTPIVVDSIYPCSERVAAYRHAAARRHRLEITDIADEARIAELLAQYRPLAAVCFAALIEVAESVARPDLYWDRNYVRPMRFFRALAAGGVRHLVFSSTAAVYAGAAERAALAEDGQLDPASPYGLTKLACELMLQGAGESHRLAPRVRFDAPDVDWPPRPSASGHASGAFPGLTSLALRYFNASGAHPAADLGEVHDPETHLIPRALGAALAPQPRGAEPPSPSTATTTPPPMAPACATSCMSWISPMRTWQASSICSTAGAATLSTWAAARATASARLSRPSSG